MGVVTMAEKKIITIGRQFGSGGKQIGEALAEKMNIPFYDKELLKEIVVFVKRYLTVLMRSLRTAFYIRSSWTLIH